MGQCIWYRSICSIPSRSAACPGAALDPAREGNDREELGGDEGAAPVERPSQDLLRAPGRIDLGGVEEVDAHLERPIDDGVRFASRVILAVTPLPGAELPGAQADLRDRFSGDFEITHPGIVVDSGPYVIRLQSRIRLDRNSNYIAVVRDSLIRGIFVAHT